MTVLAFADIEIICKAEPDKRLSLKYTWLKDDLEVDFEDLGIEKWEITFLQVNSRRIHSRDTNDGTLRIPTARGRHSGTYRCIAQTAVDTIESSATVTVKGALELPVLQIIVKIPCWRFAWRAGRFVGDMRRSESDYSLVARAGQRGVDFSLCRRIPHWLQLGPVERSCRHSTIVGFFQLGQADRLPYNLVREKI